jgi:glycosyltransferase involved in cell wall biosynthesis
MRIGIVPIGDPHFGGVYQYSATMLKALRQHTAEGGQDEFVVFSESNLPDLPESDEQRWRVRPQPQEKPLPWGKRALEFLRETIGEGPHRDAVRAILKPIRKNPPDPKAEIDKPNRREFINEQLHREGVSLMLYPSPLPVAFETEIPYVMAVHDLQHRLQPEFPEVSAGGEWERREYLFRNGTRYATLLLADSEVGKEDILNFYAPYGVTEDQVKVLPFLPACYLMPDISEEERHRVRAEYHLPERYLFYPAQFWPHKNHKRIIQALALLKDRGMTIDVVFCGSHTGGIRKRAFREVMSLASQSGLEKNIHYKGYVADQDMSGLYAEAAALVMPTFFGPTNIPVLEAWALGCPVLTSDIRGIREQVQNAAVLADPRSVESIAEGISRLWNDKPLAEDLVRRGRQRLSAYTPADYRQRLIEILEEGKIRSRNGHARVGSH